MANVGYATLTVIPSAKGFASLLNKQTGSALTGAGAAGGKTAGNAFASAFAKIATTVIASAGARAIASFTKTAVMGAGDLEQSIGAIDAIFKENANTMHEWSRSAQQDVGLTRNEFNELGTLIGAQLKNGGTAMEDLAPKTNELIKLGADLASMFGGTTRDAVESISSALKGERDPIEKYGVTLRQATIDAKAAELGFKKVGGALTAEATQAATLALIMEQTVDAHGNFAKESDTFAHKLQVLTSSWGDLKTEIGLLFLPAATRALELLQGLIGPLRDGVAYLQEYGLSWHNLGKAIEVANNGLRSSELGQMIDRMLDGVPAVRTIINELIATFRQLAPAMRTAAAAFSPLSRILDTMAAVAPRVRSVVVQLADAFARLLGPAIQALAGYWSALIENSVSTWEAVMPSVISLATNLVAVFTRILPLMAQLNAKFGDLVARFWELLAVNANKFFNALVPIIDALFVAFGNVLDAFSAALPAIVGLVNTALLPMLSVLPQLVNAFASIVPVIAQLAATLLPMLAQAVVQLAPVFVQLVGVLANAAVAVMPALVAVFNALMSVITALAPMIGPVVSVLAQLAVQVANIVAANIGPLLSMVVNLFNALVPVVMSLVPLFVDLLGLVAQVAVALGGALASAIAAIAPTLVNLAATLANGFIAILPTLVSLLTTIINGLTPLVGIVVQLATAVGNTLAGALSGILPSLVQIASTLASGFMAILPSLASLLGTVVSAFAQLSTLVMPLASAFNAVVPAIQGVIGTGVDVFIQTLSTLLPPIVNLIQVGLGIIQQWLPLISELAGALAPVLDIISQVASILSGLMPAVQAIMGLINPVLGVVQSMMPFIQQIVTLINQLVTQLAGPLAQIITALSPILSAIMDAIMHVATSLAPVVVQFMQFVADLLNAITPLLPPLLDLITAVLDVIIDLIGAGLMDFLYLVVDAINMCMPALTNLVDAFTPLMPIITELLMQALTPLIEALDMLLPVLPPLIELIAQIFSAVGGPLLEAILSVLPPIAELIKSLIEALVPYLPQLIELVTLLVDAFVKLAPPLLELLPPVFEFVRLVTEMLIPPLMTLLDLVLPPLIALLNMLLDVVVPLADKFLKFLGDSFKKSVDDAKRAGEQMKEFFGGLPDTIRNALGDIGTKLYESGKSLIEGFLNGIKDLKNKAKDTVNDLIEDIRDFFPFSPAKEGPLSGFGYVTYSGKALMEDFAGAISHNTPVVARAAQEAAGAVERSLAEIKPPSGGLTEPLMPDSSILQENTVKALTQTAPTVREMSDIRAALYEEMAHIRSEWDSSWQSMGQSVSLGANLPAQVDASMTGVANTMSLRLGQAETRVGESMNQQYSTSATGLGAVRKEWQTSWGQTQSDQYATLNAVGAQTDSAMEMLRDTVYNNMYHLMVNYVSSWQYMQEWVDYITFNMCAIIQERWEWLKSYIWTTMQTIGQTWKQWWQYMHNINEFYMYQICVNTSERSNYLFDMINKNMGNITTTWALGWNAVTNTVNDAWNEAVKGTQTGMQRVVDTLRPLPDNIKAAIPDIGSVLRSSGESVMNGFIEGMKDATNRIGDTMGDAIQASFTQLGAVSVDALTMGWAGNATDAAELAAHAAEEAFAESAPQLSMPDVDGGVVGALSGKSNEAQPLVGNLTFQSSGDLREDLNETMFHLRRISRGGVYGR